MALQGIEGSSHEPPTVELATVIPFPTPPRELPSDWAFSSKVIEFEATHTPKYFRGRGQITPYHIAMSDGSEYKAEIGEPLHQVSPVIEASTTAYLTGLSGFNRHHLLKAMEHGFVAIKIGAETFWEDRLSQPRTGHNLYQATKMAREMLGEVSDDRMVLTGVSRAAMLGLFVKLFADQDDTEVPFMNLNAPCFPVPGELDAKTVANLAKKEPLALMRHLGSLPLSLILKYKDSFDLSPEGIRYAIEAPPMLMSGDAGKAVAHLSRDTHAFITTYSDDDMCMGREWARLFAPFPNVQVVDLSGGNKLSFNSHLRCMNYGESQLFSARQARLAAELSKAATAKEIDYEAICA